MNILYVHGLGGGVESQTGQLLKNIEIFDNIYAPEIPFDPFEAIKFIKDFVKEKQIDIVVGHSLGGFYSMMVNGVYKLLINPAMKASEDINSIGLGTFSYHSKRANGDKVFTLDDGFINRLKELEDGFYRDLNLIEKEKTFGLFGTNDELFSHIDDYKNIYNNKPFICDSKHSLLKIEFNENVPWIISEIKRQYFIEKFGVDMCSHYKVKNEYECLPEELLKFRLINDGKEYCLDGMYNVVVSKVLKIPSTYNNLPVTKINHRSFVYCFYHNCGHINKIIIPNTIKEIDAEAFINIRNLKEIEVDKDNKYLHIENNCVIRNSDNKVVLKTFE